MIVGHLNLGCPFGAPAENDSPLIVDPDGMQTFQSPFECFESVARWNGQVLQANGCVQVLELSPRRLPHLRWKAACGSHNAAMEQVLRQPVLEGPDHRGMLSFYDNPSQGQSKKPLTARASVRIDDRGHHLADGFGGASCG